MNKLYLPESVTTFIKSNRLAVIATVAPNGIPEAALVYYGWDQDLKIDCCTYNTSRKFQNIQTNNKVALVIGQEVKAVELQLQGTAEIVTDKSKKADMMDKYAKKATENRDSIYFPPLLSLTAESPMEFIQISIEWFKYSVFESHYPNIMEGRPYEWTERPIK